MLPYSDKIAAARAWMRAAGVHQLGTEHERQSKASSANGARRLEDRVQHAGQARRASQI
jgi:hypothetical protein